MEVPSPISLKERWPVRRVPKSRMKLSPLRYCFVFNVEAGEADSMRQRKNAESSRMARTSERAGCGAACSCGLSGSAILANFCCAVSSVAVKQNDGATVVVSSPVFISSRRFILSSITVGKAQRHYIMPLKLK